jgi:leader peptidase (prepilin peptidase) / N-methyltransferase
MFDILSLLCIPAAIGLLIALSVIDLKHWILPDELNFALGVCGIIFHFSSGYLFMDIKDMLIGGAVGAGMLYIIRYFANRYYGRDTLGLGDVKLLGAAGLWLGLDGVLQAVTVGALAGLVHGVGYAAYLHFKHKTPLSLSQLSIPAGPGFAVGIFAVGAYMFHPYIKETIHALLA